MTEEIVELKPVLDSVSEERINKIKTELAETLGSSVDSVKLVGLSLIFLDTESELRIESKILSSGFNEDDYD